MIPSILSSPLMEKGLNKEWMLWLTSFILLVTKEAVPLTIIGIKATDRITITIRQIQGFIFPPKNQKVPISLFIPFQEP